MGILLVYVARLNKTALLPHLDHRVQNKKYVIVIGTSLISLITPLEK